MYRGMRDGMRLHVLLIHRVLLLLLILDRLLRLNSVPGWIIASRTDDFSFGIYW